jgi:inner membrane protein
MEPVTHILTGACLARTGFNRKAAYATLTMMVAAEFPDIDKVWSLRGPIEGFQHHRGITHTFLGLPFEAALIVAAVYGYHRWRETRAAKRIAALPADSSRTMKPLTLAPVRWGLLYGFALIGLLSHLLLDYTNNYGLRPFYPFNDRWYAASIVFIFDPVIFGLLLVALVAPALFSLVGAEVGARRPPFKGKGWAIAALWAVAGLWSLRAVEHSKAVDVAMAQSITAPASPADSQVTAPVLADGMGALATGTEPAPASPAPVYLGAQRALASPDLFNPFRWSTATDFGPLYQLAEVDTLNGALTPGETTFPKPSRDAVVLIAERSRLGRAYLDWSPMPIVDVSKPDSNLAASGGGDTDDASLTIVSFRDPRFMGGWMHDLGRTDLTGEVAVDPAGHVVRETLDGKVEGRP